MDTHGKTPKVSRAGERQDGSASSDGFESEGDMGILDHIEKVVETSIDTVTKGGMYGAIIRG